MARRPALLAALSALAYFLLGAGGQRPTFHADTRLVLCQVSVLDHRGQPVTGLTEGSFALYDSGKRKTIEYFAHENVPVALGLVIDNSAETASVHSKIASAALSLAQNPGPQDQMFVVNFSDEAFLDLREGEEFTNDPADIAAALGRMSTAGGDAMRDAVAKSLKHIHKSHNERKALVLVTNGSDSRSLTSEDELLRAAKDANTCIYAIVFLNSCPLDAPAIKRFLHKLTNATGGEAYFPRDVGEINDVAALILQRIRQQYVIGFKPDADVRGTFHSIKIGVNENPKWIVRTRLGYTTE